MAANDKEVTVGDSRVFLGLAKLKDLHHGFAKIVASKEVAECEAALFNTLINLLPDL